MTSTDTTTTPSLQFASVKLGGITFNGLVDGTHIVGEATTSQPETGYPPTNAKEGPDDEAWHRAQRPYHQD